MTRGHLARCPRAAYHPLPVRSPARRARLTIAALLALGAVAPRAASAQDAPVRPGDRIRLRVYLDTALVDTLIVGPRGNVVMPFAGDVRMGGLRGDAVQDSVRASLTRFVAPGAVEATLFRRVRVLGEVMRPGVLFVDRSQNLRDALAMAGGATQLGRPYELILQRGGQRYAIRDWRVDSLTLAPIESGDELTVPRLPWYMQNVSYIAVSAATLALTMLLTLTR